MGKREVRLSPRIWIDREDFRQEANKKFKRLVLGKRVRLRGAYVIEAERCELDDQGEVIKVYASIVPQTLGGDPDDGVKAKGVIHWVDAEQVSRRKLGAMTDCSLLRILLGQIISTTLSIHTHCL